MKMTPYFFPRNVLGLTGHKRFIHPFNLQKSDKLSETKSTLVFLLKIPNLKRYYVITHKVIYSGNDFMGNRLQNHGSLGKTNLMGYAEETGQTYDLKWSTRFMKTESRAT